MNIMQLTLVASCTRACLFSVSLARAAEFVGLQAPLDYWHTSPADLI